MASFAKNIRKDGTKIIIAKIPPPNKAKKGKTKEAHKKTVKSAGHFSRNSASTKPMLCHRKSASSFSMGTSICYKMAFPGSSA